MRGGYTRLRSWPALPIRRWLVSVRLGEDHAALRRTAGQDAATGLVFSFERNAANRRLGPFFDLLLGFRCPVPVREEELPFAVDLEGLLEVVVGVDAHEPLVAKSLGALEKRRLNLPHEQREARPHTGERHRSLGLRIFVSPFHDARPALDIPWANLDPHRNSLLLPFEVLGARAELVAVVEHDAQSRIHAFPPGPVP